MEENLKIRGNMQTSEKQKQKEPVNYTQKKRMSNEQRSEKKIIRKEATRKSEWELGSSVAVQEEVQIRKP